MAVALTDPVSSPADALGALTYSFAIQKFARDEDGDLVVSGVATDGSVDSDQQIAAEEWSAKALEAWHRTGGNVRLAHDARRPIGKGLRLEIDRDGDGKHWVHTVVVDPLAQRLIEKGVLTAYSIGIMNPVIKRDPTGRASGGIICGGDIGELSIVDRPANPSAYLSIAKAAGGGAYDLTGTLTAPDDLLAKVSGNGRAPRSYKSVSVDLPSTMRIKVSPANLAKMNTMARRNAVPDATKREFANVSGVVDAVTGGKGYLTLDEVRAAAADSRELAAFKAAGEAEDAVLGKGSRTFTAEQRREHASEGTALADGSYPMPDADAVGRAAILIRSKHGNWKAAAKLLAKRVRALGIPNPLKKKPKAAKVTEPDAPKTAEPDVTKCGTCQGTGMSEDKPCPDCAEGKKTAKAMAALDAAVTAPMGTPSTPAVTKKKKVMCGHCGAKQNAKHAHCPECGNALYPGAMPVANKNHEFACLHCGHDPLDKGEPHCPGCGRENPGYLPEADHQIPANKAADAGKERVTETAIAKARKGKPKKGKKGKGSAFGGSQAPPFGAKDDDDADDAKKAAQPKAEKKRKGGKKGGKGRSPLEGVAGGQATAGLPAHRDGGEQIDPIEADAQVKSADMEQMVTAMRYKSLGIPPELGYLHDLCCPAYHPDGVARAIPHASLAEIDTGFWQSKALDAAGSGDAMSAIQAWNQASAVSRAAVMLKAADPEAMRYIALADFAAFAKANKAAMKAFRDATPGPASFSPPGQPVAAGNFRRPYISAGHGAPSPMHDAPRSFPVPSGGFGAQDFTRDYISSGHASQSPQNDGRSGPVTPGAAGTFSRADAGGIMRDDLRQARATMDDHLSRLFPGVCPVSPQPGPGGTQRPAPGVGTDAHPVPHAAGQPASKSAKASAKKAAKAKTARRRKDRRQSLKAAQPVTAAPAATGAQPDAALLTEAVKAATAPLAKRMARQDKALRRLQKTADAVAGQPDLSGAPHRGPVAARKQAPAAPAGPLTAAETAAQAQLWKMRMLQEDIRDNPDPAAREASWDELMNMTGLQPMTPSVPAINRPLART